MLDHLNLSDLHFSDPRRLVGNEIGKRPLLVKLENVQQKFKLLGNTRFLRQSGSFKTVFINPDLTPRQQSERRALLEELRRRQSNGDEVVIYRNKIVEKNKIKNFH